VVGGKLEPIAQVQEVRMPVGGVTEAVLVKEGEMVKAGQVLFKLDTEATAGRRLGLEQSMDLKLQQLTEKAQELSRYLELNSTEQSNLRNNISLQQDIVARLDRLQKQGATAELQLLQERNRLQETQGKLEQTQVDRQRQQAILSQQRQQLSSELAQLRSQLSEQTVTLRYQEIRSPVDGMVFDLKPKGAGFVAQTSEPVLKIVPQDNLQAAVEIPSRQIGFVRVGQQAEVSIDSYPSNDFGVLQGEVKRVSSDALAPDASKGEQEYRYPGLISLNKQTLRLRDGRELPLQAGMSLSVHTSSAV
jgi:HlyD family secretion protein